MPLIGFGTFKHDVRSKAGRVYVPAALVRDSQFPIKEGKIEIRIEGKRLTISNYEGSYARER